MATAPHPVNPELVAIAVAYRNTMMIADSVLPRVPVGLQEFKYYSWPVAESFAVPDDTVGRKSAPNQVDLSATETLSKTEDHGLDDFIPEADIRNANGRYDPKARAVVQIEDYIQINREKRCADLVFAAANYPTGNKITLSGTSQWSDAASTPIAAIMTGIDTCLMRPNVMVIGRAAFTKLAQHADILKAVNRSAGDKGVATRQAIADLFELEEVLVGEGQMNTAKKGQAAVISRIWGKHALLFHRNKVADTQGGLTFGFTAEFGEKIAWDAFDPKIGLKGAWQVRNGESVKELIVAPQAAYFIENAVA